MSDVSDSPEAAVDSPAPSSPIENDNDRESSAVASSDEDESPVKSKPSVRRQDRVGEDEDGDADLFGEESGDEGESRPQRTLDDAELDSGDDEGRQDRLSESEPEVEQKVINTVDISLGRHGVPYGTDGELYLLRNAQSTGIEPRIFDPGSFKPPTSSHHGAPPLKGFSAAHTANTTVRWRRDPDNPKKLQSNSRIIRWSDGSLTLQMGSNPQEQLELPAVAMASPQQNPRAPTPTSVNKVNGAAYDSKMDAHLYLASAHQDAQFLRLTNHVTAALNVQTRMEENDDALIRLQENMAAASKNYARAHQDSGPTVMKNLEDPELAKKKAEAAEKEKLRAERRRLNQEQRMRERQDRVYGRAPRSGYGAAGLTVGGLEDDGLGRPRPKAPRKPRRRGSEYSDDDDDFRRGKTKEDEYDEDDGFLVRSGEESEVVEDSDEEEEVLGSDADAVGDNDAPAPTPRSPKRPREEDAEGGGGGGGKRGKRMVLDEDEDDE